MNHGRIFMVAGALSGFISVAAGAFGAHALKERLEAGLLAVFETGSRYQMYHALALLATAWAASQSMSAVVRSAGWCFIGGTLLFSGSLYLLALTGTRWWGAITPIGGLLFLAGWLLLAWGAVFSYR